LTTVSKIDIRDGFKYSTIGSIDERLPAITTGLIAHYPFDGIIQDKIGLYNPIITQSNCTIKSDGLCVESNTNNYNFNQEPYNITGGTHEKFTMFDVPVPSSPVYKFTKNGQLSQWVGWQMDFGGIFDAAIGECWTISGWYKTAQPASDSALNINFALSDMSRPYDCTVISSNITIIPDGKWHFFYRTIKFNEAMTDGSILDGPFWDYSSTQKSGELYINGLQWEKKPYYTSWANGARGNADFRIDFGSTLQNILNYTVRFDYIHPDLSAVKENSVFLSSYDGANSGGWFGIMANSNVLSVNEKTTSTPNTKHTLIISYDGTNSLIYLDGSLIHIYAGRYFFNGNGVLSMSSGFGWQTYQYLSACKCSMLSIYNRVLSAEEVKKLSNNLFSISSTGDLKSFNVIEKPYYLPGDAYYYPLGMDAKTENKAFNPSEESNVRYENGAAWIGNDVNSSLEYNLYSSIGLDWSKDWSIVYWKKPIGTQEPDLTGYNIESIGCNSNSVGGGYSWWGKNYKDNTVMISGTTGDPIDPTKYFNTWRMIAIRKSGTTITYQEFSPLEGVYSKTLTGINVNNVPNYYVTQYGYDFKLGGWDNANPCNTWFRDLIITKRLLTDTELSLLYRRPLCSNKDKVNLSNQIGECE
jgi:hypothetical protein